MPAVAIAHKPRVFPPIFFAEDAARFSALEIREAIAHWVREGRLDLADPLVAAGLCQYPDSEDILALGALVAEVQQDWPQAQDRLEALIQVQGARVTAETLHHLVRVLRCRHAYVEAYLQAEKAVALFPRHEGLQRSHCELKELLESVPLTVTEVLPIG